MVAVVVPSPATSLVLVATSRSSCAPVFSQGSLSSISRTIVTPSLVTVGAPNFFSRTTLRPLGPRVIRTERETMSMPLLSPWRASTSKWTALAMRLVAGVLGIEHLVADLELHRDLLPAVQDPACPDGLDDPLLWFLLGRVGNDDPALCLLFPLDGLHDYPVAQRPQIHGCPPHGGWIALGQ